MAKIMKKKEFLKGFYRTIGTGAAILVGIIVLIVLALVTGAEVDFAGININ